MVISPAKTQEMPERRIGQHSQPALLEQTKQLVQQVSRLRHEELVALMKTSPNLTALTVDRYQNFSFPFTLDNAGQALLVFQGDQFGTMDRKEYTKEDFDFAQQHLRILSGLYGVLRPLDLIQPYRLEMATPLPTDQGKNLYAFWNGLITRNLDKTLSRQRHSLLINLASDEYFKAIHAEHLGCPVLKIVFKEIRNGTARIVAIHAKRARGLMVDFVLRNRITEPEMLKNFFRAGYRYDNEASTEKEWIFFRRQGE